MYPTPPSKICVPLMKAHALAKSTWSLWFVVLCSVITEMESPNLQAEEKCHGKKRAKKRKSKGSSPEENEGVLNIV